MKLKVIPAYDQRFEICLDGAPLLLFMVLCSEGFYPTSKLSSLTLHSELMSENERELYLNWCSNFSVLLNGRFEMAPELARYITPINMPIYSGGFIASGEQLIDFHGKASRKESPFNEKSSLFSCLSEIIDEFDVLITSQIDIEWDTYEYLPKPRKLSLLADCVPRNSFGTYYRYSYEASFGVVSEFIQSMPQIKFEITQRKGDGPKFYIPSILEEDESLQDEFYQDLNLAWTFGSIPAATIVGVVEYGATGSLVDRCDRIAASAIIRPFSTEAMYVGLNTLHELSKRQSLLDLSLASRISDTIDALNIELPCTLSPVLQ